MFHKFDKNDDGYIEKDELLEGLRQAKLDGSPLSEALHLPDYAKDNEAFVELFAQIFAAIDRDENCLITELEWAKYFRRHSEEIRAESD